MRNVIFYGALAIVLAVGIGGIGGIVWTEYQSDQRKLELFRGLRSAQKAWCAERGYTYYDAGLCRDAEGRVYTRP